MNLRLYSYKANRFSPVLAEVELLLRESPLPWTWQMLVEWFDLRAYDSNLHWAGAYGIRRLQRGVYTSSKNVPDVLPVVPRVRTGRTITVTSAMVLKQYGVRA